MLEGEGGLKLDAAAWTDMLSERTGRRGTGVAMTEPFGRRPEDSGVDKFYIHSGTTDMQKSFFYNNQ